MKTHEDLENHIRVFECRKRCCMLATFYVNGKQLKEPWFPNSKDPYYHAQPVFRMFDSGVEFMEIQKEFYENYRCQGMKHED